MKKNKKHLLFIIIIPSLLMMGIIGYAFSLIFYNPFLSGRMADYYSNDSNFNKYKASIKDVHNDGYLEIESIKKMQEDGGEISIDNINFVTARVFSKDIKKTMELFDPIIGESFYFIGSFKIFYDGCPVAIVQISIGDIEVLNYSEGKAALLEWASKVH